MALITPIHGEMSGSIAGNVYAHNKAGQYVRQRVVPTNPNTTFQQTKRTVFAALAQFWTNGLNDVERALWDDYAANVQVLNRQGNPMFLSGMNWFITVNTLQNAAGGTLITAAPSVYSLDPLNPCTAAVVVATQVMTLTFDDTQPWASEDGAFMLVQQGKVVNGAVNFFKGPFRVIGSLAGDSVTPQTSPNASLSLQFLVSATSAAYFRIRVIRADGRPSTPQIIKASLS